jgi:hypothetical protein
MNKNDQMDDFMRRETCISVVLEKISDPLDWETDFPRTFSTKSY